MTEPLFRPEVIEAQSAQYLGSIRIGQRLSHLVVALVALGLAAALVCFAIWGQMPRKVRVAGMLVPALGTVNVGAPGAGTLAERRVREGETVAQGQVLFVIDTDRTGMLGVTGALVAEQLRQREQTLKAERLSREAQVRQRSQALQDRLRSLGHEISQAEAEQALAERRVALARRSVERYEELARDGFVSEIQSQNRHEEMIDLQVRQQAAQRLVSNLGREQQALRAELDALGVQLRVDLAQIDRAVAALGQETAENDARRRIVVTAAQAGTVTALYPPQGAAVQAGQTLATLVPQAGSGPADTLHAELYAPSRTAGFVRAGQTVWLRYAAYPYQKFGLGEGQVVDISRTPVAPQDLPAGMSQALLAAAGGNEPLYRVAVRLARTTVSAYGVEQPLKPGMTLEADVLQERRAVWEWLFEPLLSVRARWGA